MATPFADLSRRAAAAVNTTWWKAHVTWEQGQRFVDACAVAAGGFDGLAPEFRAMILRAEGKSREADALSYPQRPRD